MSLSEVIEKIFVKYTNRHCIDLVILQAIPLRPISHSYLVFYINKLHLFIPIVRYKSKSLGVVQQIMSIFLLQGGGKSSKRKTCQESSHCNK
jgi:hypothetical protein